MAKGPNTTDVQKMTGPDFLRWMANAKSALLSGGLREIFRDRADEWEADRERIRVLKQGIAEFRRRLYEWSQAYPIDVFLEPPDGQHGETVDACFAAMGRYVTRRLLGDFDECIPMSAPAPEEGG